MTEKLSLCQSALRLGYHKNHFYVMKKICKPRFDYLLAYNPDNFEDAYGKYVDDMEEVKNEMIDFFYILEDDKKISTFGNPSSAYFWCNWMILCS